MWSLTQQELSQGGTSAKQVFTIIEDEQQLLVAQKIGQNGVVRILLA